MRVGGLTQLAVIDVDNKGGKAGSVVLAAAEQRLGPLPRDVVVSTPNNGFQYDVEYPPEWNDELLYDDLGEALSLGEGVDIKTKGYVCIPPSIVKGEAIKVDHPANNGYYVFMNGLASADVMRNLPKLPEAWVKACIKPVPDMKEWDVGAEAPDSQRQRRDDLREIRPYDGESVRATTRGHCDE